MSPERRAEIKAKMASYYDLKPLLAKGEEAARKSTRFEAQYTDKDGSVFESGPVYASRDEAEKAVGAYVASLNALPKAARDAHTLRGIVIVPVTVYA